MTQREGIYYPVIAPFDEAYAVDHEVLAELIEFGIDGGIDGVFALGSAGQGPVIDPGERKAALETIVDAAGGRVPIVAHVGTADTRSTVDLAEHAASLDVDMLAVLPPYYYSHSPGEIQAHFEAVADAVDLEMMIYNNERFTGIDLTPADMERLTRAVPAITGIKASFTDAGTLLDYVERTPPDFSVFSGNILHLLPTLYDGVAGSIHPPTSIVPELAVEYLEATRDRDLDRAMEKQRALRAVSKVVSSYAGEYGRGIYVPLFGLRGIDIERYPKWETEPIPDGIEDDLSAAFADAGLDAYIGG